MSLNDIFESLNKKSNSIQNEIEEEKKLLQDLAERYDCEVVDLDKFKITKELIQLIPNKIADKYLAFPIELGEDYIKVVFSNIEDLNAIDEIDLYISSTYNRKLIKCIASKNQIAKVARDLIDSKMLKIDRMIDDIYDFLT